MHLGGADVIWEVSTEPVQASDSVRVDGELAVLGNLCAEDPPAVARRRDVGKRHVVTCAINSERLRDIRHRLLDAVACGSGRKHEESRAYNGARLFDERYWFERLFNRTHLAGAGIRLVCHEFIVT